MISKLSFHELSHVKVKPWTQSWISLKTITINDQNFSVETGCSWLNWEPEINEGWSHVDVKICSSTMNQVSLYLNV